MLNIFSQCKARSDLMQSTEKERNQRISTLQQSIDILESIWLPRPKGMASWQ
jgi:hypothetical protein